MSVGGGYFGIQSEDIVRVVAIVTTTFVGYHRINITATVAGYPLNSDGRPRKETTKMPHFDKEGRDTWICQICGSTYSSYVKPEWNPKLTGHTSAGNVCPSCRHSHDETLLVGDALRQYVKQPSVSLAEHCRRESGLTGAALQRYINRHYGHG